MKQTPLQFIIFFFAIMLAFQAQGQVTITKDDFPRQASFIDSFHYTAANGIANPMEGPNQVWNYSYLPLGDFSTVEHFDASSDPNFLGSLNYSQANLSFSLFIIESNAYEAIDIIGFFEYGRSITDVTHSITELTGDPDDVLHFIGENQRYDYDIDEIEFPLNYEDTWTDSRNEYTKFELSLDAFGLNQTPGDRRRFRTQTNTVVGHGSLTIPKSDGSASAPMDALLMKVVRTDVDSFFLGGNLMPESLLDLFGLIQGQTETATFYNFYTPGFAGRVLELGLSTDNVEVQKAYYRPQAADDITAIYELDLPSAHGFPNPVSAGEEITITLEESIASGSVSFMDLAGRQVFQAPFEAVGNQFQIGIPAAIGQGLYFYHVLDKQGIPVGLGKLQVN